MQLPYNYVFQHRTRGFRKFCIYYLLSQTDDVTLSVPLRFECLICLTCDNRKEFFSYIKKVVSLHSQSLHGKTCQRSLTFSVFPYLRCAVFHSLGTIDGSRSVFGQSFLYIQCTQEALLSGINCKNWKTV